jgi:DNA-binding transcriptional regulator YbjK
MTSTSLRSTPPLSGRRRELVEAALHVVADEGLRGLTHRAVDRRAGLPEGTTSAYFRTRVALQTAVAEYVATALAADVDALAVTLKAQPTGVPDEHERAAELTRSLFERWLDERELLLARMELSLEASRNPAIAELLGGYRDRLVLVVDGIFEARQKPHDLRAAEAMVASFDGLLLAALTKPPAERRAFLTSSLALILRALSEASVTS